MNKISYFFLDELKRHYGTWSAVARALGMEPRHLLYLRTNSMSKPAAHRIRTKAKQLRLARLIGQLLRSGVVSRAQIRRAWVEINRPN